LRQAGFDELRPQYHLLPASNWMNDPNGPIYFSRPLSQFHQYNPKAPCWREHERDCSKRTWSIGITSQLRCHLTVGDAAIESRPSLELAVTRRRGESQLARDANRPCPTVVACAQFMFPTRRLGLYCGTCDSGRESKSDRWDRHPNSTRQQVICGRNSSEAQLDAKLAGGFFSDLKKSGSAASLHSPEAAEMPS